MSSICTSQARLLFLLLLFHCLLLLSPRSPLLFFFYHFYCNISHVPALIYCLPLIRISYFHIPLVITVFTQTPYYQPHSPLHIPLTVLSSHTTPVTLPFSHSLLPHHPQVVTHYATLLPCLSSLSCPCPSSSLPLSSLPFQLPRPPSSVRHIPPDFHQPVRPQKQPRHGNYNLTRNFTDLCFEVLSGTGSTSPPLPDLACSSLVTSQLPSPSRTY